MTNSQLDYFSDERELIAFRVGQQEFCIDVMMVREVRGWAKATTLPRSPAYVKGVINLRGSVLPIIDLSLRLGMGGVNPTERNVVIVVQIESRQVGILVDAVSDILTTQKSNIQPAPELTSNLIKNFIKGLLPMDGRMVSLISLDNILPNDELDAA